MPTFISWADETHNFWTGCDKVSQGCKHCYAERVTAKNFPHRRFQELHRNLSSFIAPTGWQKPRLIFTCSMSDFFHPGADEWRRDAWYVIKATPRHRWLILTKRLELARDRLPEDWGNGWENVWIGVSAEDQPSADKRLPQLRDFPAAHRFVSCEPLLGVLDIEPFLTGYRALEWVIVGGESGDSWQAIRPMDVAWAQSLRMQCVVSHVPFHFKQMGGKSRGFGGVWGGDLLEGEKYQEFPVFWPPEPVQMELL